MRSGTSSTTFVPHATEVTKAASVISFFKQQGLSRQGSVSIRSSLFTGVCAWVTAQQHQLLEQGEGLGISTECVWAGEGGRGGAFQGSLYLHASQVPMIPRTVDRDAKGASPQMVGNKKMA